MWIKRRDYEELKKVSGKYSDVMKAIHSTENGAVTFCNFGVLCLIVFITPILILLIVLRKKLAT